MPSGRPPQTIAGNQSAPTAPAYQQVVEPWPSSFSQQAQADDGSFSSQAGPGVTAIVATALLRHGRTPDDPLVAKSLKYLEGFVHDDGGIYAPGSRYQNYETWLAICASTKRTPTAATTSCSRRPRRSSRKSSGTTTKGTTNRA